MAEVNNTNVFDAEKKFVDFAGLDYFWKKAKTYVDDADKVTADKVDTLEGVVGNDTSGLVKDLADLKATINAMDVEDVAVEGQYVSSVSEIDGKVVITRTNLPVYEEVGVAAGLNDAMDARVKDLEAIDHGKIAADASAAAVATVIDGAPEKFDTLKEIATWIDDSESAAEAADLVTRVTTLEAIDHDAYKAADEKVLGDAKAYADSLAPNYDAAGSAAAAQAAAIAQAKLDAAEALKAYYTKEEAIKAFDAKGSAATAQTTAKAYAKTYTDQLYASFKFTTNSDIDIIWGGKDYTSSYFTIEALEDGLTAKLSTNACEYRIDDGDWNTLSADSDTLSVNKGQTLSFRGNLTPIPNLEAGGIGTFVISKKCNLKGNIMSLLYGDDFVGKNDLSGKTYTFYNLFKNCVNIVDASQLILPATTLAERCYQGMFNQCTSLTTAPELPATTLKSYCYRSMFANCSSLTTAPELPATTLASYCYSNMFYNCSSLTTAPELPATILAPYCYEYMFYGCSSLTTAPELPATTLASYCYSQMFYGCSSLTTAPELPATTLAERCYQGMFNQCTSLTTAPELPATTLANYCYSSMFNGCSSLTTAPELPATTLANYCYSSMFQGCSSLTTAPELPATTLANYCYDDMFNGCKLLTTAPELPATTLNSFCYSGMFLGCSNLNYIKMLATNIRASSASSYLSNWVYGVASSGTFIKHPDITSLPTGWSGIPNGWTVVDAEI